MKKLILASIVLAIMAAPAMASPTITSRTPPGVDLQDVIDNITVTPAAGSSINVFTDMLNDSTDSYWETTASGQGSATMIIELAGYATTNIFGVYNGGQYVKLFAGSNIAGDTVSMSIKLDGSVYVNSADTGIDFASTRFGFYLDSRDDGQGGTRPNSGLWHSDTLLNSDSTDHMAAYRGNDSDVVQLPNLPAGTWTSSEYILAFEDLDSLVSSDYDYTDFVVMVESVQPIPAPGALLLGSLGVSFVGWLRRRRSL